MEQITIKDIVYEIHRLDAMKQFHIARRLAPALFAVSKMAGTTGNVTDVEGMANALQPVVDAISSLSDTDSEYVIMTCLGVVKRKVTDSATQSVVVSNKLQFSDMELDTIMPLTFAVIKANLGSFFNALPTQ